MQQNHVEILAAQADNHPENNDDNAVFHQVEETNPNEEFANNEPDDVQVVINPIYGLSNRFTCFNAKNPEKNNQGINPSSKPQR